jgi:hypothetical protein
MIIFIIELLARYIGDTFAQNSFENQENVSTNWNNGLKTQKRVLHTTDVFNRILPIHKVLCAPTML